MLKAFYEKKGMFLHVFKLMLYLCGDFRQLGLFEYKDTNYF